mmetsp:Transcript_42433/g.98295  ORF Transcript_42433/g.98295 Transcript_42433/m.98295 type:complete len:611 (-) Transcript_42433:140-1972(-)
MLLPWQPSHPLGICPSPVAMLRLPSLAMRWHEEPSRVLSSRMSSSWPSQAAGDSPVRSPDNTPEAASSAGSSDRGRLPSVRRSRFFLEHESGCQLHDIYKVEPQPLGEGGFGTVCRARMHGAEDVVRAVKAVKKKSIATESMVRDEVAILRSLDHPYICRLFEIFDGPKCMYMVMEYVDGQELFDYIQQASIGTQLLTEDFAANIMQQVFSALQYCHSRRVVHRDLKPENVMVQHVAAGSSKDSLEIKLIDFGLAAVCTSMSRPASGSVVGTRCYLAPEACHGGRAHPASDLWSAGMVLHTLLLGGLPDESVRMGDQPLPVGTEAYAGCSAAAQELLAGLLQADRHKRLTAAQAGACAWLKAEARAIPGPDRILKTMDAFSVFHRSTMLRRAVLTALAMQAVDHRISDLQAQFLAIDGDKNGRISRSEFARSIAQPGSMDGTAEWVESVFNALDTDGSAEIEYTEWIAAALQEGELRSDQAIRAAFRVFDVDSSGKISAAEIARVTSQTDAQDMLPQFDLNGDGELDFEEFRNVLRRAPQPFNRPQSAPPVPRAAPDGPPRELPKLYGKDGPVAPPVGLAAAQNWCSVQWRSLSSAVHDALAGNTGTISV